MKKITSISFAVILSIISCQKQQKDYYFYTYIQSDPAKLDPFYSTDVISGRILAHLCNGLFKIDKAGNLQKDLIESFTFNGRQLKAGLRKDVFFHNGVKLDARDIVFSFSRIMNSNNPTSPRKWIFDNVKTIEAINNNEFYIMLKKPSSTFLYILTMPNCYIISENSYMAEDRIIGTGPFILSEWKRDEQLTLVKNPTYFSGKPGIDGIVYRIIPEDLTARFEFLNGTIDYFEIPYLANISIKKNKIKIVEAPELSVHYIAINTSRSPFNDKIFRKAINMALDRDVIMKSLLKNRFIKATGPVPPAVGDYSGIKESIHYDNANAKKIIWNKGLEGKEISLLLKSDNQVLLICQMIQHFLNKAGLSIKVRELEWSALKAATLKGDFDLAYFTWHADYPEAENFIYPLFFSENKGTGGNRSFYSNPEVDRLLIKAEETTDSQKRFAIYQRIERIIVDDAPWIFLWYGDKKIAFSEKVKNFTPYPIYSGMKGEEIELWH